jgi:hypothetical protein
MLTLWRRHECFFDGGTIPEFACNLMPANCVDRKQRLKNSRKLLYISVFDTYSGGG